MNNPEPAKSRPDNQEGSELQRYFMHAANGRPPAHKVVESLLSDARDRVSQLEKITDVSMALLLPALWDYATYALESRKLSLAIDGYQKILNVADPTVASQVGYFGGALQRTLHLLLADGSIPEFIEVYDQVQDKIAYLDASDRCCVSLLCAGRELLMANEEDGCIPDAENEHLVNFQETLRKLSRDKLSEILPWIRNVLGHFENNNVPLTTILPIVEDTLTVIERNNAHFQPTEYLAYRMELARLHCLTGEHEKSYLSVIELSHATECLTFRDMSSEIKLRKNIGYLLGKLSHFREALEETNAALELVSEQEDFVSSAHLHLQRIDILTGMGRGAEAMHNLRSLREDTEDLLPRRLLNAIKREEVNEMLSAFSAARAASHGEEFVQLVDVYATVMCAELLAKSPRLRDMDEFRAYQRVVEFIDRQLKVEERRQKILVEEGVIVIHQQTDDYSSLRTRLEREYPLFEQGTLTHSKVSWLLAIVTLRDEIDGGQGDVLDVDRYLQWGEAGIDAHLNAKRFLAAASLLSLKGQFYFDLGAVQASFDAHQAALDAVNEGGFLYTRAGHDVVQALIDLSVRSNRTSDLRLYRDMFNEIEGKLSRTEQAG